MKMAILTRKGKLETKVTGTYSEIAALIRRDKDYYGPCPGKNEGEFFAQGLFFTDATPENKMKIRNRWNAHNPEYAICAACGKPLHEHNRESHFESKFGVIGPECFKKYAMVL